jgi:chaperone required for assembly of F1-ATPase
MPVLPALRSLGRSSLRRPRPPSLLPPCGFSSLSEHAVPAEEGAGHIAGPSTWRGVARFYKSAEAARAASGAGWQVLIDGRPLRTNTASDLVLPCEDLAWAIAAEFAAQGDTVVPATTALYNLASTAVDTYVTEDIAGAEDYEAFLRAQRLSTFDLLVARQAAAGGGGGVAGGGAATADAIVASARSLQGAAPSHADIVTGRESSGAMSSASGNGTAKLRDLVLDCLETDSVCYRVGDSADPSERLLRKRQDKCVGRLSPLAAFVAPRLLPTHPPPPHTRARARKHTQRTPPPRYYGPLQQWFENSYAVRLGTAEGFAELLHPEAAYLCAEAEVDDAPPWAKAALGHVVSLTKSAVIGLAFSHGALDTRGAFEAARLEEEWQIVQNGLVEDGHDAARAHARAGLAAAAAFLALLPRELRAKPLPVGRGVEPGAAAWRDAAAARVRARRVRETALVAAKRSAMREHEVAAAAEAQK